MDDRAADPEEWQQAIADHEERQGDNNDDFTVWPENWRTVRIFLLLTNCFQQDSMSGRYQRIPRSDIECTVNMCNIRRTHKHRLLADLVAMESAALEVMNRSK